MNFPGTKQIARGDLQKENLSEEQTKKTKKNKKEFSRH